MIPVTPTISLAESEIAERFLRAPGPGGQNVNKLETAVQLRFDAANSPALSDAVFRRLAALAGRRLTREGVIVITARRFRTRERNRLDAMERLIAMIREAAVEPKRRRPTKPTAGSRRRLRDSKQKLGEKKKSRAKPGLSD